MKKQIESNYKQVKSDILKIVVSEMERIKNDPDGLTGFQDAIEAVYPKNPSPTLHSSPDTFPSEVCS